MSPHLEITPNTRFLYNGNLVYFRKRARDPGGSYIFESEAGVPFAMLYDEVKAAREKNVLQDYTAPLYETQSTIGSRRAWVSFTRATSEETQLTERVLDYVLEYQANPGAYPRTERGLGPLLAMVYERRKARADQERRFEPPAPKANTLARYIRTYQLSGGNPDALVPQVRNRGNYRCKLMASQKDMVATFIDDHYLKRNGDCAAEVHRKIRDYVRARNKAKRGEIPLVAPSYEAVLAAISKLCAYTVSFCRDGETAARNKWRSRKSGIVTDSINEVWEIDDTWLDAMALHEDRKTVIGRPWLTLVIDRHSRMIMSFVISFHAPDTRTALEAMRLAMHSKARLLGANPSVQGDWLAEGRPKFVHVDNASYYNSAAFIRALTSLGIGHRTMPVLKPWYKGTVERALGTTMRQVFHTVPGTTYANIFHRDKETPPEDVATFTISELRQKLLRWIVEDYQNRHHRGIEATPRAIWMKSRAEITEPLPPTAADIDLKLSPTVSRKLRLDGIELHGLKYFSEELSRLTMAPKAERPKEIIIRVTPENLTAVEFLDPTTKASAEQWLPAYLDQKFAKCVEGRTLDEYLLACAVRRANPEEFSDDDSGMEAAFARVDEGYELAARSKKVRPRLQAAGHRERQLKEIDRLNNPAHRSMEPTAEGEDLQSLINSAVDQQSVASNDVATSVETPASDTDGVIGGVTAAPLSIGEHAHRHGLGSRVRRRVKTGDK